MYMLQSKNGDPLISFYVALYSFTFLWTLREYVRSIKMHLGSFQNTPNSLFLQNQNNQP